MQHWEEVDPNEITPHCAFANRISSGAQGTVYKITWRDKLTAVKILHTQYLDAKEFQRELTSMSTFNSQYLVPFYGACTKQVPPMLLMKYMEGGSLGDLITKTYPMGLPLGRAVKLASDVLQGLSYMHNGGFIHRDLKPENILLDKEQRNAFITDFGCSREMQSTVSSEIVGTKAFISPEVIASKGKYSSPADMYSFGITFYVMLLGKSDPFFNRGLGELLQDVLGTANSRPVFPSEERIVPPELKELIERCWAPKADERPSADQALECLEPFVSKYEEFDLLSLSTLSSLFSFGKPAVATDDTAMKDTISKLKEQLDGKNKELVETSEKLKQAEKEANDLKKAMQDRLKAKDEEVAQLAAERNNKQAEIRRLEEEKQREAQEREKMAKKAEDKEKELEQQIAQMRNTQAQLQKLVSTTTSIRASSPQLSRSSSSIPSSSPSSSSSFEGFSLHKAKAFYVMSLGGTQTDTKTPALAASLMAEGQKAADPIEWAFNHSKAWTDAIETALPNTTQEALTNQKRVNPNVFSDKSLALALLEEYSQSAAIGTGIPLQKEEEKSEIAEIMARYTALNIQRLAITWEQIQKLCTTQPALKQLKTADKFGALRPNALKAFVLAWKV